MKHCYNWLLQKVQRFCITFFSYHIEKSLYRQYSDDKKVFYFIRRRKPLKSILHYHLRTRSLLMIKYNQKNPFCLSRIARNCGKHSLLTKNFYRPWLIKRTIILSKNITNQCRFWKLKYIFNLKPKYRCIMKGQKFLNHNLVIIILWIYEALFTEIIHSHGIFIAMRKCCFAYWYFLPRIYAPIDFQRSILLNYIQFPIVPFCENEFRRIYYIHIRAQIIPKIDSNKMSYYVVAPNVKEIEKKSTTLFSSCYRRFNIK